MSKTTPFEIVETPLDEGRGEETRIKVCRSRRILPVAKTEICSKVRLKIYISYCSYILYFDHNDLKRQEYNLIMTDYSHRYKNFRTMVTPQPAQLTSLALDPSGDLVVAGAMDPFEVRENSGISVVELFIYRRSSSPSEHTFDLILAPA